MTQKLRDCLGVAIGFALPLPFLRPFQNVPFIDDWVYAWSVEWLLKHHEIRYLEISAHINAVQILWGAMFCLLAGFSFTALRISTWVTGTICLCGVYLTLRDLDVFRRDALIGVASLALYPIFFVHTFTFMTDVPFLAAVVWFCFALIRAVRSQSDLWLIAAVLCACMSMAVRLPGTALAVVLFLILLFSAGRWGRHWARLLLAATPFIFVAVLVWSYQSGIFHSADLTWFNAAPANKAKELKDSSLRLLPRMLLQDVTFTAGALGIALLPLSLAGFRKQQGFRVAVFFGLLVLVLVIHLMFGIGYKAPLEVGGTWSVEGLGATRPFIAGYNSPPLILKGSWLWMAVTMFLGAIALGGMVRRRYQPGEACLIWVFLSQFFLAAILWLIYDRYALVLVPASICLLLVGRPIVRPTLAMVLIGVFAAISLVGTRDDLEYNRALWSAVDSLRQMGVPDSKICGSYVIDGWLQYAHPEHAPRDESGKLVVPWLTGPELGCYRISNQPVKGRKSVLTIPYRQWLGGPGFIYVAEPAPAK